MIVPPDEGEVLKVVDAPLHNNVPALLLIDGADGVDPVVTTMLLLNPLVPQRLVSLVEYEPAAFTA